MFKIKGVRNPGRDEIHEDGDRIRDGKKVRWLNTKFWEGENLHPKLDLWKGETNKCPMHPLYVSIL